MSGIPLQLLPDGADARDSVEIDGALVASRLGLPVERFRALMGERKVAVLCERATGEDAGLYRATFYYEDRRSRAVVDGSGRVVQSGR